MINLTIWIPVCFVFLLTPTFAEAPPEIHLAVEFVDHAASAHIARNQGWYAKAGLKVKAFDSYATGMALSAALCKGDVDAAAARRHRKFTCLRHGGPGSTHTHPMSVESSLSRSIPFCLLRFVFQHSAQSRYA